MILSIIVPIYNVERFLEECVSSLEKQNIPEDEYEIILVDDGSIDRSYDIAVKLTDKRKNIIVYRQKNQGQAVARNFGIDKATGKYIMFVDSDDYLVENTIDNLVKMAEKNDTDLCVFSLIKQQADGNMEVLPPRHQIIDHVLTGEQALLSGYDATSACAIIYKRDFIESGHFRFRSGFAHEDVEFSCSITPYAKRMIFSNIHSYVYRWNENSTDRSRNIDRVKHGIISDLYIAASLKDSINNPSFSKELKNLYYKKSNSIVVSLFLNLIRKRMFDIEFVKKCIETAKYLRLYPVYGRTVSWKTSIIIPLVNFEYLYYFLYLYRDKKA